MTTNDTHVGASTKSSGSSVVASVGQWMTSSDHKKIGRLFIGWSLVHAIEVAVIGIIFGLERMSPSSMQIFDGDAALQLSWLFRHVLVLGLLAPLFIGIAIAVGFAYHLGKTLKDWEDDKLTNENKSQLNLSFI